MFFDWLIIFLIWLILIIILVSIIFYNRLRVRDYYFSNTTDGDTVTFTQNGDYYSTAIGGNDLAFKPLYKDRNRNISGGLVLLSSSTSQEYYRIKVVNGTKKLSEGIYLVEPGLTYNTLNFSVDKGDNRALKFEAQKYNVKTQKVETGSPNMKLVKAWAYYY